MGGYGSGRPGSRPVAETSLALRIGSLNTSIALTGKPSVTYAGIIRWTRASFEVAAIDYTLSYRGSDERWLVLRYHYCDEPVWDGIQLVSTRPNYGGQRWWFRCASCGRRCGVLYAPGRVWRCRTCWNVTYTSSNESDPRVSAMLRAGDLHALKHGPDSANVGDLILALKVARKIGVF